VGQAHPPNEGLALDEPLVRVVPREVVVVQVVLQVRELPGMVGSEAEDGVRDLASDGAGGLVS